MRMFANETNSWILHLKFEQHSFHSKIIMTNFVYTLDLKMLVI